jgi:8-oxo-dGTP pyrophosphatase MutT (NUDIX family)
LDVPHVWLKETPTMNGNFGAVNFAAINLSGRAGNVLAHRRRPQESAGESLPKGEMEAGLDVDEVAAALRELQEETLVSPDDIEIVKPAELIGKTHWVCCKILPTSQFAQESAWFTGVQNPESVRAAWRSWSSVRSESWIPRALRDLVDPMLGGAEANEEDGRRGRSTRDEAGSTRAAKPRRKREPRAATSARAPAAGDAEGSTQCRNAAGGRPCARDPCPHTHDEFPAVERSERAPGAGRGGANGSTQCRNAAGGRPCAHDPCPHTHDEFPAVERSAANAVDYDSTQCRNAANGRPCARDPCPHTHDEHAAVAELPTE